MGIFSTLRKDERSTQDIARAVREARRLGRDGEPRRSWERRKARKAAERAQRDGAARDGAAHDGAARDGAGADGTGEAEAQHEPNGPLERMLATFEEIGIDGRLTFSSAEAVADRAERGRGARRPQVAVRRIIRVHRRGVTFGGFVTGLGGLLTLVVTLPLNIAEFYIQAIRMTAGIAAVRGYDVHDEETRTRILACLVGEEASELLSSAGLGPVATFAGKRLTRRMPDAAETRLMRAIGARILRRFSLRSVRLFGKSIPLLGGVIGAVGDRSQLARIAKAADEAFPARS